jgi:hypothetical protein
MCHTFIQAKVEMSAPVNILSNSSKDVNPKANILASDDEESCIHQGKKAEYVIFQFQFSTFHIHVIFKR